MWKRKKKTITRNFYSLCIWFNRTKTISFEIIFFNSAHNNNRKKEKKKKTQHTHTHTDRNKYMDRRTQSAHRFYDLFFLALLSDNFFFDSLFVVVAVPLFAYFQFRGDKKSKFFSLLFSFYSFLSAFFENSEPYLRLRPTRS